jgi:hypothetical protein
MRQKPPRAASWDFRIPRLAGTRATFSKGGSYKARKNDVMSKQTRIGNEGNGLLRRYRFVLLYYF